MEKALIIIFIGMLVFMAHAFVLMFQRTKVPDILYLIIIGLIIGPIFQLTKPEDFGKVGNIFSTIALVVILFEGGLELQFDLLKKTIKGTLALALTSYFAMTILLTVLFYVFFQYDLLTSMFIGSVLAGPAPSVVIPLLKQLKLQDRTKTTLTLESGLGEALCILISLAIFESIKLSEIQTGKAIGGIFASFFIAVIIGVLGGYFWSLILNKIRQLSNAIFTTPSFVFIVYGVCDFLGFSGPIGVLAFGATLCNIKLIKVPFLTGKIKIFPIEHNEIEKMFFSEIVFLLKTFFFVYLGLSIQFKEVNTLIIAAIIILIIFITRIATVRLVVSKKETNWLDASTASAMISKGLATAVLASLLVENRITNGEQIQSIIYFAIVVSVISTSLLIFLLEKTFYKNFMKKIFYDYLPTDQTVKINLTEQNG